MPGFQRQGFSPARTRGPAAGARSYGSGLGNAGTLEQLGASGAVDGADGAVDTDTDTAADTGAAGLSTTTAGATTGSADPGLTSPPGGDAPTLDQIRAGAVLEPGMAGPAVTELQERLSRLGFGVQATGTFGPTTVGVLQAFQAAYRVEQTGKLGPTTLARLVAAEACAVTLEQLRTICPAMAETDARAWLPYLNASMEEAALTTEARKSAYIAQLAHETDGFHTLEEYASGADYEGRSDLGNTEPGDGKRFKGRGAIQLTGRANYAAAGAALGVDLVKEPERAADPDLAFRLAAWYWTTHDLNTKADEGDFTGITRAINGGQNGADSRAAYHAAAQGALKAPSPTPGLDEAAGPTPRPAVA